MDESIIIRALFRLILWSKKLLILLLVALSVYMSVALILSSITVNPKTKNSAENFTVYLLTNGVHLDIVVPKENNIKDWETVLSIPARYSAQVKYISFGWGDKAFYMNTPEWSDLKASTAFQAIFLKNPSAMHVTYYHQITVNDHCVAISIDSVEYAKLTAQIQDKLKNDSGNKAILIPDFSYGSDDQFYESKGIYHLFNTCNTWVNTVLKKSGMKARFWTPFAGRIFSLYNE